MVFNTIVPPGLTPFLQQLYDSGFTKRGGHIVCTYFDENFLNLVPAEQVEGLYGCLDYYQDVGDPFSEELLARYDELFPGSAKFTAGSACTGMYRGLKLWEAAVNEAGSLEQEDVIAALDHAKIAEGPGGPAEMVPGQHHVRMNMYIAQAHDGTFKVVEDLGVIDPKESVLSMSRLPSPMRALQITELSGPRSALSIADLPEPEADHPLTPGSGVLIDVHAAGVAFPEVLQTRGEYQYKPDLPFVPGTDIGGVVRSAPEGSGLARGRPGGRLLHDRRLRGGGRGAGVPDLPAVGRARLRPGRRAWS